MSDCSSHMTSDHGTTTARDQRLGRLEDAGSDFPFYNGVPVAITGAQWLLVMVAVAAGFAMLMLPIRWPGGAWSGMIPALLFLKAHGADLGLTEPWQMFWATGALSSFLDNTPTYLVFMTTAGALGAAEGVVTTVGTIAVPMLIGNIFQQLYNIVDSIVVGKYVGSVALAAVGASFPILFTLSALIGGVTIGGSVLVSQYLLRPFIKNQ